MQACSVLGLEHGTEQAQLPQHEIEDLQQNPERSAHAQKLIEPRPDRTLPDRHTDSDTQQPQKDIEFLQNALNATTRRVKHPRSPTILQQEHMLPPQPARHHPFGEGHVQARSVLGLEHSTEQKQLPQHETEDLQQNWERSKHAQKLAEP